MKDSPTKTICFLHSPTGFGETEEKILAACKEEMRKGNKVILVTSMGSQLAVKAIQERVDVYKFRIGKLSFLNPLKIMILMIFNYSKRISYFASTGEEDQKIVKLLNGLKVNKEIL